VKEIVARVLELDPAQIADDATSADLRGWDSLRQLEIMLALELEFGIRIPAESMVELTSVPAIEGFLEQSAAA
jgi:acyl carrier protein